MTSLITFFETLALNNAVAAVARKLWLVFGGMPASWHIVATNFLSFSLPTGACSYQGAVGSAGTVRFMEKVTIIRFRDSWSLENQQVYSSGFSSIPLCTHGRSCYRRSGTQPLSSCRRGDVTLFSSGFASGCVLR